uniref:FPL domain-containing protein n=1 Tax=Chaetoceros debilis TaxID=122233 RepID=A0A7S3V6E3_9STRA
MRLFSSKLSINGGKLEDYNISKLRSMYSDLLTIVEPSGKSANKENNGSGANYTVRNFRRSRRNGDPKSEQGMDDEVVHFDTFATESLPGSINTWLTLSATKPRSHRSDNSTNNGQFTSTKAVNALVKARKAEARLIELIRSLLEIVVYGEQHNNDRITNKTIQNKHRRSNDAVFEYFCDKNMLSLFVDICKAKPNHITSLTDAQDPVSSLGSDIAYGGVVWTSLVKAQVLQSISILISNVSEPTSIFYLLSNNSINELIYAFVPLRQFTEEALDEILPVYISFLKTLALLLADNSKHLFHFFCNQNGSSSSLPTFPLLYAACEVISSVSRNDSFVQTTCLNIILNIFQLPEQEIRDVIGESFMEQTMLFSYLAEKLHGRYETICECMAEERVNLIEHGDKLECEVAKLEDLFHFVNDLLWCSQRSVNVRACEFVVQFVVSMLNEVINLEVIETHQTKEQKKKEATLHYQASMFFLNKVYTTIDYTPLLKMILLALFHPYSPAESQIEEMSQTIRKELVLTSTLNAIAQNDFVVIDSIKVKENDINGRNTMEDLTTHVIEDPDVQGEVSVSVRSNPYRRKMLTSLSGSDGDGCFLQTAMMIESAMISECMDISLLRKLGLVPNYCNLEQDDVATIGSALGSFFQSPRYKTSSVIGKHAFDCAISLSAWYAPRLLQAAAGEELFTDCVHSRMQNSAVFQGLVNAKRLCALECAKLKAMPGISEFYSDLVEAQIRSIFDNNECAAFSCNLAHLSTQSHLHAIQFLLPTSRILHLNEIENAKFAIHSMLLSKLCQKHFENIQNSILDVVIGVASRWVDDLFNFKTSYTPTSDLMALGCLIHQPIVGSDFVIEDQTHFHFSPSLALTDSELKFPPINLSASAPQWSAVSDKERRRQLADKILIKATNMILIINPIELLVLKPKSKVSDNRGTIMCCTLLSNVIAVAMDGEWLHIAMKNVDDVGALIKKGNMALRFNGRKECLAAREYIESTRTELKNSLSTKMDQFLKDI